MTQRRIYQEEYPYFVTTRIKNSLWLFDNDKYAGLLSQEIFKSGEIKGFDILCYQIMPDYLHMLVYGNRDHNIFFSDRTLESVRSGENMKSLFTKSERTFSKVRSHNNLTRSREGDKYNISDLMQSIKGNFSQKIHQGNIWQKRFYSRIISNEFYLENAIEYIKQNPIK